MTTDQDHNGQGQESTRVPTINLERGLAAIALLLSIIALIMVMMQGSGERRSQQQAQADAEQQQRQMGDLQNQFAALGKQQQTMTEQTHTVSADVDNLRNAVRKLSTRSEPSWVLKEVGYYIRLSIVTQQVQGDAASVLALLQQADALLGQETPKFAPLRQALALKIMAIKSQAPLDKLKLVTQLNSVANSIASLPLAVKVPGKSRGEATTTLLKLIVIRHHDEPIKALLTSEALQAIQQNIQLLLQQAAWAIVQRDQAIYQTSLQGAARWVSQYFDTDASATKNVLATLKSLQTITVAPKPVPLDDLLTVLASSAS
jgi:uroporphyrin-3 C-methyltransferase